MKFKEPFIKTTASLLILGVLIAGCFLIEKVTQPSTALGGSEVIAIITVRVEGRLNAVPQYGIAAFLIPNDWSASSPSFDGGGYTDDMSYLHPDSSDKQQGGSIDYWNPALEEKYPSGDDYQWVVFQSNNSHIAENNIVETKLSVIFSTSLTQGTFNIGYFVSDAALDFSDTAWYSASLDNPILISGVIPVELTSFTASNSNQSVVLTWETATETNNRGFEIERSLDNVNFSMIGFVAGNGTTNEKNYYSFIDNNVTGTNFYRLKQIDNNGTFTYSSIVEVKEVLPHEFSISQNYPNPFNPTTTVSFGLPVDAKVNIILYNSVGETVRVISDNDYSAGIHYLNINASDLSSGTYIYSINARGIDGRSFTKSNKMILIK